MGGTLIWPGLPSGSGSSRCVGKVTIEIKFFHRGLHRTSKDERTVTTASLKPDFSNGSHTAEGFCRNRDAAYLIMARRLISTNRPDTLTQTFLHPQLFPCSRAADHTFGKQSRLGLQSRFFGKVNWGDTLAHRWGAWEDGWHADVASHSRGSKLLNYAVLERSYYTDMRPLWPRLGYCARSARGSRFEGREIWM
jgi:hypothetical protein